MHLTKGQWFLARYLHRVKDRRELEKLHDALAARVAYLEDDHCDYEPDQPGLCESTRLLDAVRRRLARAA